MPEDDLSSSNIALYRKMMYIRQRMTKPGERRARPETELKDTYSFKSRKVRLLYLASKIESLRVIHPLYTAASVSSLFEQVIYASEAVSRMISPGVPVIKNIREAIDFNPDVIFTAGEKPPSELAGLRVNLFGKLFDGQKSYFKVKYNYDLYCTSGPAITVRFMRIAQKEGNFLVSQTGWTATDTYFNSIDKQQARDILKVSKDKRLVLLSPGKYFTAENVKKLRKTIAHFRNTIEWIIFFPGQPDPATAALFSSLKEDSVHYFNHPDLSVLFKAGELLITDRFDVALEFSLLEKPVIISEKIKTAPSGVSFKMGNLIDRIETTLTDPDQIVNSWSALLEQIQPYRDGKSSERVLKVIIEIFKSGIPGQLQHKSEISS